MSNFISIIIDFLKMVFDKKSKKKEKMDVAYKECLNRIRTIRDMNPSKMVIGGASNEKKLSAFFDLCNDAYRYHKDGLIVGEEWKTLLEELLQEVRMSYRVYLAFYRSGKTLCSKETISFIDNEILKYR